MDRFLVRLVVMPAASDPSPRPAATASGRRSAGGGSDGIESASDVALALSGSLSPVSPLPALPSTSLKQQQQAPETTGLPPIRRGALIE